MSAPSAGPRGGGSESVRGQEAARGSATPGMACGDRPVESAPSLGDFPAAGIPPRSGVKGAGPYAPLPPPPSGRLAYHPSLPRAGRPKRHPSRQSAAQLAEAQPQVANRVNKSDVTGRGQRTGPGQGRAEGGTAHAASITPIVMESSPSHDGAITRRDVYDPRPLNPSLVSNRTAL